MEDRWSSEKYPLTRVAYRRQLPCVVKVDEGILMDTEAETFSAGDIIKLDKHTRIPKIEANFVRQDETRPGQYKDTRGEKIFVPLNYQGKVKVANECKTYNTIKELVDDFPRFVTLRCPLAVVNEMKEEKTLNKGDTVELDRLIPGVTRGVRCYPDKLVLKQERRGAVEVYAVYCDRAGQFQSKQDDDEYTLKQIVDRYQLPRVVHFLGRDLSKIYMDSLVDVVENVTSITDTLRITRLVQQEVLIGHYKPLEEYDPSLSHPTTSGVGEPLAKRTLVVLPLEAEFVRELDVSVLEDATEDDYEQLSLVRHPSRAVEAVEEMIYVDFVKSNGIVRIDSSAYDYVDAPRPIARPPVSPNPAPAPAPDRPLDRPPPRPPKSMHKPRLNPAATYDNKTQVEQTGRGSYVDMEKGYVSLPPPPRISEPRAPQRSKPQPPQRSEPQSPQRQPETDEDDYLMPSLANVDFSKHPGKLSSQKKPGIISKFKDRVYVNTKHKKHQELPSPPTVAAVRPSPPEISLLQDDNEDADADAYEEIDANCYVSPPKPKPTIRGGPTNAPPQVAVVTPHVTKGTGGRADDDIPVQAFQTLSVEQLHERLVTCGMHKLAEVCRQETLDGDFICKMDANTLKEEPFNLAVFELKKLDRVKQNWVPT